MWPGAWLLVACGWGADTPLEGRLAPLVRAHHGKVAVAVRDLRGGETYEFRADEPMPTASLIKLAVMVETYQQVAEGRVRLSDRMVLHEGDKVPGSGVLTLHFSDGTTFTLRDAVRLMIAFSDNTATNLVLDRIGVESTARRMAAWGYPNTKIHHKVYRGDATSVFPERSRRFGLGSTTAREMVRLLQQIEEGKVVGAGACKEMIEHLKQCDDKEKFPRFLPEDGVVAHKTGSINDARTDAGILYLPGGPVALCVLTAENRDTGWRADNAGNRLCALVAREVWDYFRWRRGESVGKGK